MSKQPLAIRIYSDPAYSELIRLVGYQGAPYPMSDEEIQILNSKYGKARMIEASDELIEHDATGKLAKLKPGVQPLCRQLLGPTPDEWDAFYAGVENPPPNPYKANKEIEQETQPVQSRRRRTRKRPDRPASDATESVEDLRSLEGVELMRRYFAAKRTLEENGEHSDEFRKGKPEYDQLKAECRRRDINLPPTGYDDPAFPFTKHTEHRLRELLDMNQYELTRYDQDSVTYQEAARDIGFIETELRRRERRSSTATGTASSKRR